MRERRPQQNMSRTVQLALALATLWPAARADVESLLAVRHPAPELERYGVENSGIFTQAALMTTPCHPEDDGYFGGTFGAPVEFQYVFEMETNMNADTPKALEVIRENLIETLVADTFPQICGLHRRQLRDRKPLGSTASKINGFWFEELPNIDLDEHCEPLLDETNLCSVFKGRVSVFGHRLHNDGGLLHVMETAIEAIGESQTKVVPHGVMRLVPSEKMTRITYDAVSGSGEASGKWTLNDLSTGAKVAVGFSSAFFVVGAVLVGMYAVFERRHRMRSKPASGNSVPVGMLSPFWGQASVAGTLPGSTLPGDETIISASETIYLQEPSGSHHSSSRHVVFQLEEHDIGPVYPSDAESSFYID